MEKKCNWDQSKCETEEWEGCPDQEECDAKMEKKK